MLRSESLRIRCWFHKMGNIRAKQADDAAEEFIARPRAVRDAATPALARMIVAEIVERYERESPATVACLLDDLEASLAHLRAPARHRRNVRTANLAERSFEEERRRSKEIPRLFDELLRDEGRVRCASVVVNAGCVSRPTT
jgi:putative transposase